MDQEKIIFNNHKNQGLVGILYSPDNKQKFPIAIFCHGYRSTKESSKIRHIADSLTKNNIGLFAFDFSGRGESEGRFEDTTLTQYIDDLKCAIDIISSLTDDIAIIGSSLGGIVSLHEVITDVRVKALVGLSPVSNFPANRKNEFGNLIEWKKKGYAYTYSKRLGKLKINYSFYEDGLIYNNYPLYEKIKIPVLIIHGTKDESVSIKYSERLITYLKHAKLIRLKDADHGYSRKEDFERIVKEISDFLNKNLR